MKKFIKWGLFVIFAVALAVGLGWVTKTFFGASENERKAVEQGFHPYSDLATNPEGGLDLSGEPNIRGLDYSPIFGEVIRNQKLLPLCDKLIAGVLPPEPQIKRLTADTRYRFPAYTIDSADSFYQSLLNLQNLAQSLRSRAITSASRGNYVDALNDMKLVGQIAKNMKSSENLELIFSAECRIVSKSLSAVTTLAKAKPENRETVEFAIQVLDILDKPITSTTVAQLNWMANFQLGLVKSRELVEGMARSTSLGTITIPIPQRAIRDEVFIHFVDKVKAIQYTEDGSQKQLIALIEVDAQHASIPRTGFFSEVESTVLDTNWYSLIGNVQRQKAVLREYLMILIYEQEHGRLPNTNDFLPSFDPMTAERIQYLQIAIKGLKRPRVLVVSTQDGQPIHYHGQIISTPDVSIVEPDPTVPVKERLFRADGTIIYESDPDYPNKNALGFGDPPIAPGMKR